MTEIATKEIEQFAEGLRNLPELSALPHSALEKIFSYVALKTYAKEAERITLIKGRSFQNFLSEFVASLSSAETKRNYERIILEWSSFATDKKFNLFNPTFSEANSYLLSLQNASANTKRLKVICLRSFYKFLQLSISADNTEIVNNPFKLLKLPKRKPTAKNKFYSLPVTKDNLGAIENEINALIAGVSSPTIKAILTIMKYTGLRIGAFKEITFSESAYVSYSKGKNVKGILPEDCIKELEGFNLFNLKQINILSLENNLKEQVKRLLKSGIIHYDFSFHCVRHFFAIKEYLSNRDIKRVSQLLGHSSVLTTEVYLKGLNLIS